MTEQKTILVAESEPNLLLTIKEELESSGFFVEPAFNKDEALRKLQGRKINLALIDVSLTETGGLELLEEMKKDSNFKFIPIIILWEAGDEATVGKAAELGVAKAFLKTRSGLKDLLESFNEILRG